MKEAEEQCLKVKYMKTVNKNVKSEPVWMTKDIKREIAKRRQINKKKRKEVNPNILLKLTEEYFKQKYLVQSLMCEAISKYEINATQKILNDSNKNKKLWIYIDLLRNKNRDKEIDMYDAEGNKVAREDRKDIVEDYWIPLYQKLVNNVRKYNDEAKHDYLMKFYNNSVDTGSFVKELDISMGYVQPVYEEILIPKELVEHVDCAIKIIKTNPSMDFTIKVEIADVRKQNIKIQNGKKPGPDNINLRYINIA